SLPAMSDSNLRGLRLGLGQRRRPVCDGLERTAEGIIKIVAALEILARIVLCLREQVALHQVEDKFAKVLASPHPPFLQDRQRHRAKLLEREGADALQQFLAADV